MYIKISRKIAAVMMAGILISVMAGCGNGTNNEQTATSQTVNEENEAGSSVDEQAGTEEITITMGRETIQGPTKPDADTYEDNAYTRMVKEELNITIVDEFESTGEDYTRQVSLALSAGEIPDMMKVFSLDEVKELYENDLIADLTDVYENYASDNIKQIYDSYDGRALDTVTFDGQLMALLGTKVDAGPSIAWIRIDWIEKLGLVIDEDGDQIITIEELEMVAGEFMDKNPGDAENVVGMAFTPQLTSGDPDGTYSINSIAYALGAYPRTWMNTGGDITYGSVADEMKETLQLVADWYQEGIVDQQLGTRTWDDITSLLANGQTGIAFGTWHIPDWLLNNARAMQADMLLEAYIIGDKDGKVNCKHNDSTNGFIVVSKECANPEAAVQIINLFYDELSNSSELLKKYPEVESYLLNGVDGSLRPFNVEIMASTSLLDDYSDISRGVNGEITVEEAKTAESKSIITIVQDYLKNPAEAEVVGWSKYHSRLKGVDLINSLMDRDDFVWLTPVFPETTPTMETNWANLNKLEEEAFIKMVTGAVSVEEGFAEFVEEWNQGGGNKILEEIKAQQ